MPAQSLLVRERASLRWRWTHKNVALNTEKHDAQEQCACPFNEYLDRRKSCRVITKGDSPNSIESIKEKLSHPIVYIHFCFKYTRAATWVIIQSKVSMKIGIQVLETFYSRRIFGELVSFWFEDDDDDDDGSNLMNDLLWHYNNDPVFILNQ
jgi:hypothetical protein